MHHWLGGGRPWPKLSAFLAVPLKLS